MQIFTGGLLGFFPFFFTFPLGNLLGGDQSDIDARLPERIWRSVEEFVQPLGAATGATQRLSTVTCPSCGVLNPDSAQWCSACGTALNLTTCANCGHINPHGATFCNQCGTPLAAQAAA